MAEGKLAVDQQRLLETAKARVGAVCDLASKLKSAPVDVETSLPQIDQDHLKRCGTNIPALIRELKTICDKNKGKDDEGKDDEGKDDQGKNDEGKGGDLASLSEKLVESWGQVVEVYWPKLKDFSQAISAWASKLWTGEPVELHPDAIEQMVWEDNFKVLSVSVALAGFCHFCSLPMDVFFFKQIAVC